MPGDSHQTTWIWYASRSAHPVELCDRYYPSTLFDGRLIPRPSWICQSPNGGLHIDARIGRIDVNVKSIPETSTEITWTRPYTLNLFRRSWLDHIIDLIDNHAAFVGDVIVGRVSSAEWQTLHGRDQTVLLSKNANVFACPICGAIISWPKGKLYLQAPNIGDQRIIVPYQGILVREDIVIGRQLRTPHGSYRPTRIPLQTKVR